MLEFIFGGNYEGEGERSRPFSRVVLPPKTREVVNKAAARSMGLNPKLMPPQRFLEDGDEGVGSVGKRVSY